MRGIQVDGQRFRQIRLARGLKQKELAAMAGVGERTVRNAEAGRRVRHDFLSFLCVALGIELIDVVHDRDELTVVRHEQRNVTRITEALRTFIDDRDLSECRRLMAPDVLMHMPGPDTIAFAGDYRGVDGLARLLDITNKHLTHLEPLKVTEISASGNLVAMEGADCVRVNSTGKVLRSWWRHTYIFEGERVARIDDRIDTHAWTAAFRK